jgi:hypothetical protein
VFAPLFAPLIAAYHMLDAADADARHVTDLDASKVPAEPLPRAAVLSTRIRVGRNLAGFPLAPAISRAQRNEVMERVRAATEARLVRCESIVAAPKIQPCIFNHT